MNHRLTILFEALYDDVIPPSRQTEGSAGYDIHAYLKSRTVTVMHGATGESTDIEVDGQLTLAPEDIVLVPTGFKARVPAGYEAQVRIRSSMAFRRGLILPNAPGTIDSDYPDEWLVMVKNASTHPTRIEHGERIAQVVLNSFAVPAWTEGTVGRSTDRAGGLGSTGHS